jgi:recombination protein RecA
MALAQIDKSFGKGSVMRLGDEVRVPIGVIPTGSIALDVALGIGGLPRGRVVEIYGPESSGKTTVALHAVANAQAAGGIAAFIDAEHALDPDYAKKLGVDTDALLVSQPDTGSRRSRSPTCWCAPVRSTSSSSTPWRRSCPAPRSRARWVTATSVCRPA